MHLEEYVLGKARVPGLLCEECIVVKARVWDSVIHLDDVYHNGRFWLMWKIAGQNHVSQIVGRQCALVCKSHPMALASRFSPFMVSIMASQNFDTGILWSQVALCTLIDWWRHVACGSLVWFTIGTYGLHVGDNKDKHCLSLAWLKQLTEKPNGFVNRHDFPDLVGACIRPEWL